MKTDFSATRALFDLPEGVIYLDGNSLGPLPRAVRERMNHVIDDEWGTMLIRGWNEAGWMERPRLVGSHRRADRCRACQRGHGRHAVHQGLSGAGLGTGDEFWSKGDPLGQW